MKRQRLRKSQDRRRFRATAGIHPGNTVRSVMRGGIRK